MSVYQLQPLAASDPTAAIIFFLIWGVIAALSQYQKWQQKRRAEQTRQTPPPPPPAPGYQFPTVPGAPRPKPPTPAQRQRMPAPTSPQAQRHPVPKRSLPHQRPTPTPKPTVVVRKDTTIVHKPPRPTRVVTPPPAIPKPQMSGPRHAPPAAGPAEDAAYAHSRASEALTARMQKGITAAPAQAVLPAVTLSDARRFLKANNLRKLFIVTELLAPPVGMRESDR